MNSRFITFIRAKEFIAATVLLTGCSSSFYTNSSQGSMSLKDFSSGSYDTFTAVAAPVGKTVDSYYKLGELSKARYTGGATDVSDKCDLGLPGHDSFADRISWAVQQRMRPMRPRLGYVASAFGLSGSESSFVPTGLLSHPFCRVSPGTLNSTFQGNNVPAQKVIDKVNLFIDTMNKYRTAAISGDVQAQLSAQKLWSKLYMCNAYQESLTSADNNESVTLAAKYLPAGTAKPDGVDFHQDALLCLGLYQFDPDSSGESQSCIREWNDLFPNCQIDKTANATKMVQVLGSSYQTFNAFCGVSKLTAMFGVQVNSTRAFNTFPSNVKTDGTLLRPDQRCVTFTMNENTSYNHFAAFQNSFGNTLESLMDCTLSN